LLVGAPATARPRTNSAASHPEAQTAGLDGGVLPGEWFFQI
jgi:hypothetical protein